MAFNAKKLRVVLPESPAAGYPQPQAMFAALDLDAITDKVAECFSAAHPIITHWCWSHTCVDVWSDPVKPMVVSAELLPTLREALEAQLREIDAAEQELARRVNEG